MQLILDTSGVFRCLQRLALQIQEGFFETPAVQIVGLKPRGDILASYLKEMIEKDPWSSTKWQFFQIDKKHPNLPETLNPNIPTLLVDDVLNTGFTLSQIFLLLFQKGWNQIETLVLVDRNHYRFPIRASYTGLHLATTFHDYVELRIEPPDIQVYLK